jgi:hypothetical protein
LMDIPTRCHKAEETRVADNELAYVG